jgi:hypothetical protein
LRRQHVVSRVILKGFAAPGDGGAGWQLTPFDVRLGREGKSRGLKGCGRVPDFLLCASESAEQLWNEVENRLGPAIKAARDGHFHDHDSHVSAIRDGIALHLVRSLRRSLNGDLSTKGVYAQVQPFDGTWGQKGPDRGVKARPPDAAVRARPCVTSPPAPSARTHSGRQRPRIPPRNT